VRKEGDAAQLKGGGAIDLAVSNKGKKKVNVTRGRRYLKSDNRNGLSLQFASGGVGGARFAKETRLAIFGGGNEKKTTGTSQRREIEVGRR